MFGRKISQVVTVLVIAICVLAVWVCAHLASLHSPLPGVAKQARSTDSILGELCGGDEAGGGCGDVVTSSWGMVKIPWMIATTTDSGGTLKTVSKFGWYRLPVALLAMCFYIFMGVWFSCTGRPVQRARRWHLIPLVLSCLAAAGSIFYICIMAFVVKDWCKLCLMLHLADFLLCGGMFVLMPRKPEAKPKSASQAPLTEDTDLGFRHFMTTLACILAACAVPLAVRNAQVPVAAASHLLAQLRRERDRYKDELKLVMRAEQKLLDVYGFTEPSAIPPRSGAPTLGDPGAPHQVVLFSDLQCPNCRVFEIRFNKEFLPLWKGKLRLEFRHLPLSTACNPRMKHDMHPLACNASYAAEAAYEQGGHEAFWRMHNLILNQQTELKNAAFDFDALAAEMGLDVQRFQADMAGAAVRGRIEADVAAAGKLGLTATPAVFLDGRRLPGLLMNNPTFWKAIAKKKLAASHRAHGAHGKK
jgi:protein-disulfide isomerase